MQSFFKTRVCTVLLMLVPLSLALERSQDKVSRVRRQTEVVLDLDAFCAEKTNGQIYRDPASCRSYIFCSGSLGYRSTCAEGLFYNAAVQTCDFDDGRCEGRDFQPVLNPEKTKFAALPARSDPSDPLRPLLGRDGLASSRESLPTTAGDNLPTAGDNLPTAGDNLPTAGDNLPSVAELIRLDKQRLARLQEDLDGELASICEGRDDGTYQHPTDCHSYVYCSNGVAFPAACPDNLIYNERLGGCDFDIDGRCTAAIDARDDAHKSTSYGPDYTPSPDTSATYRTSAQPRSTQPRSTQPDVLNNVADRLPAKLTEMMPSAIERAMTMLTETLQEETEMAKKQTDYFVPTLRESPRRSSRPFKMVQQFLKSKPIAKQLSMPAFVLNSASQELIKELGADSAAVVLGSLVSPLPASSHRLPSDAAFPAPEPGSCPWPLYNCRVAAYRSLDASCNNLHRPLAGRALTPFRRLLPPQYGDGLGTPRASVGGAALPPARRISATVAPDRDLPHHMNTVMLMQWGQFVDHDLTLTAISKIVTEPTGYGRTDDIECGTDGCSSDHKACVPIDIPDDDPVFSSRECLEFVRSQEVPNINCTMGPREQLNQITSYLDASGIYGSSLEDAAKLRDSEDKGRGRLLTTPHPTSPSLKDLLPQTTDDPECTDTTDTQQCFKAGDERVNEQVILTVMHTIWLREHNRIEATLHKVNPHWDGEKLYQETRRIVGAMVQHVTYNEFLPSVLGPQQTLKSALDLLPHGFYEGYNSSVDSSIANVFAAAAFRFGHTLIPSEMTRTNASYHSGAYPSLKLNELFFRPAPVYNTAAGGVDGFLRGLCSARAQTYDRFVTREVTTRLFSEHPPLGLGTDLVSLNIMRARDHGIPGYNAWREWCGLGRAAHFEQLVDVMEMEDVMRFKQLYSHVDDVDLFPAGISERPVAGGLIGPTLACIVATQFRDLRQGDRFWYENNGANRFSPEQLQEIRKVTLAKVICTNSDNITEIQPRVMELPFREAYPSNNYSLLQGRDDLDQRWFSRLWRTRYNERRSCDCLPQIDLDKWREAQ